MYTMYKNVVSIKMLAKPGNPMLWPISRDFTTTPILALGYCSQNNVISRPNFSI